MQLYELVYLKTECTLREPSHVNLHLVSLGSPTLYRYKLCYFSGAQCQESWSVCCSYEWCSPKSYPEIGLPSDYHCTLCHTHFNV